MGGKLQEMTLAAKDFQDRVDALILNVERTVDIQISDDGARVAAGIYRPAKNFGVDYGRAADPTYYASPVIDIQVLSSLRPDKPLSVSSTEQRSIAQFALSPDGNALAYIAVDASVPRLYTHNLSTARATELELPRGHTVASDSKLVWKAGRLFFAARTAEWRARAEAVRDLLTRAPVIVHSSEDPFSHWERLQRMAIQRTLLCHEFATGETSVVAREEYIQKWEVSQDANCLRYIIDNRTKTDFDRPSIREISYRITAPSGGKPRSLSIPTDRPSQVAWSPNGNIVAFCNAFGIYVGDIGDWAPRQVMRPDGSFPCHRLLGINDDGSRILFESNRSTYLATTASSDCTLVADQHFCNAETGQWSLLNWDHPTILLHHRSLDRWQQTIAAYNTETQERRKLLQSSDFYDSFRFAAKSEYVCFTRAAQNVPADLFFGYAAFTSPVKILETNRHLNKYRLARPELIEFRDSDGNRLRGVWYCPDEDQQLRKYPTVFILYEQFFSPDYNGLINLLTSAGMAVVTPSIGAGPRTRDLWLKTTTAAANMLIDTGRADPERLGLHGESYGGFGVLTLLTQTKRFRGAVSVGPVANAISFYGDSPWLGARNVITLERGQYDFGGSLWQKPLDYLVNSPVLWADRIQTPLLLITGGQDLNVPPHNTAEMYFALRRLGRRVQWVHYPNNGHAISFNSKEDWRDYFTRLAQWWCELFGL